MFVFFLCAALARAQSMFGAWVGQIKVQVPEQMTEQPPFLVGLKDIVCGGFAIDSLPSSYPAPLKFTIAGVGLSFECNMTFSYKNMYFPYIPSGDGKVHVQGAGSWIQLSLSFAVLPDVEYPLPGAVSVDSCTTKLSVSKLDLPELGLGDTVSNIVSLVIRNSVELLLPTIICDEISLLIKQNLTDVLLSLNEEMLLPMIRFPLNASDPPLSITLPNRTFDWQSSLFQLVTAALDDDGVAEITHLMGESGLTPSPQQQQPEQWCELSSNIEGPGINTLMNIAANEEGMISVGTSGTSIGEIEVMEGVMSMSIEQVNITGLRAFQNFSLLRTIDTRVHLVDNYVLTSLMRLPNLQVLLGGEVRVRFDDVVLHEKALFNLSLTDLTAYMSTVSVLDLDRFQKLFIGQLSSVNCWLSAFTDMNVTNSGLSMQWEANLPVLHDEGMEKDFALAVTRMLALIKQDFGTSVSRTVSGWAAYYRSVFNQDFSNGTYVCPKTYIANIAGNSLVDWRANAHPLAWIDDLLTAILVDGIMTVTMHNGTDSEEKGPPALNGLLDCVTVGQGEPGNFKSDGSLFTLRLGSGEESFELELRELELSGLDSFDQLNLLAPVSSDASALRVGFIVGNCSESWSCSPLTASVGVSIRLGSRNPSLARLSLILQHLDVDLQLHAPLSTGALNQLRVEDVLKLQCVLSVFPSLAVDSLHMSVHSLLADLKLDKASSEKSYDVTNSANELLSSLPAALIKFLNGQLESVVREAPYRCHGDAVPPLLRSSPPSPPPVIIGITALVFAAVLALAMAIGSRARAKITPVREVPLFTPTDLTLNPSLSSYPATGFPLANHPRLSLLVRVCVPAVLLCAITVLITAHVSSGARVTLWISSEGGSPEPLAVVSEFTLAVSVADMWNAGVPLLAFLVALLSGFWPYIKLFSMLSCWFLPPSRLPVETRRVNRGCVLNWLHALGKWSLIDAFVLAVLMVAFRFHISPHTALPFLDASLKLDVTLEPEWGITGFILATMVSMLMSEVCLWAHTKAENTGEVVPNHNNHPRTVLWKDLLAANASRPPWRTWLMRVAFVGLVGSALVLPIGIVALDLLGFQFSGLVSLVMNPTQRHQTFTGSSFGSSMMGASLVGGFDTWLLKWTFVLHAILVPITHSLGLCMLLLAPLSIRHRSILHRCCTVLSAWACLDVLLASLLGGLLQLGLVAEYLVGDFCRPVDSALQVLGVSTAEQPLVCFGVSAEFRSGLFILIITTTLTQVISHVITRTAKLSESMDDSQELQLRGTN